AAGALRLRPAALVDHDRLSLVRRFPRSLDHRRRRHHLPQRPLRALSGTAGARRQRSGRQRLAAVAVAPAASTHHSRCFYAAVRLEGILGSAASLLLLSLAAVLEAGGDAIVRTGL